MTAGSRKGSWPRFLESGAQAPGGNNAEGQAPVGRSAVRVSSLLKGSDFFVPRRKRNA